MTEEDLIPADVLQCQAIKPNGNTFMSLGGVSGYVRCTNVPVAIITESVPDENGTTGSMSVCKGCLDVALKQLPEGFFVISNMNNYA